MAIEIERKFLVSDPSILRGRGGTPIIQGYLAKVPMTVRVRVMGSQGFLTLKGPSRGYARDEYEYPIPLSDALAMLRSYCGQHRVCKTRYEVPFGGHVFEVDVFEGALAGLVLAEVELLREEEEVELPPWVGREVTGDPRYGNYALARTQDASSIARWQEVPALPQAQA